MKNKKLPAFTLAETLVVLVIASIVIAMGFLVFSMVRKQVIQIQKNYQKKLEVQFFETTFLQDFNRGDASFNQKSNLLLLKNIQNTISYSFSDTYVVREKDTFQIEVLGKKLFLHGNEVQKEAIDAIEINLNENFGGKQLFIHQEKDASFYMNEDLKTTKNQE